MWTDVPFRSSSTSGTIRGFGIDANAGSAPILVSAQVRVRYGDGGYTQHNVVWAGEKVSAEVLDWFGLAGGLHAAYGFGDNHGWSFTFPVTPMSQRPRDGAGYAETSPGPIASPRR
jgi:hypothetical protein